MSATNILVQKNVVQQNKPSLQGKTKKACNPFGAVGWCLGPSLILDRKELLVCSFLGAQLWWAAHRKVYASIFGQLSWRNMTVFWGAVHTCDDKLSSRSLTWLVYTWLSIICRSWWLISRQICCLVAFMRLLWQTIAHYLPLCQAISRQLWQISQEALCSRIFCFVKQRVNGGEAIGNDWTPARTDHHRNPHRRHLKAVFSFCPAWNATIWSSSILICGRQNKPIQAIYETLFGQRLL